MVKKGLLGPAKPISKKSQTPGGKATPAGGSQHPKPAAKQAAKQYNAVKGGYGGKHAAPAPAWGAKGAEVKKKTGALFSSRPSEAEIQNFAGNKRTGKVKGHGAAIAPPSGLASAASQPLGVTGGVAKRKGKAKPKRSPVDKAGALVASLKVRCFTTNLDLKRDWFGFDSAGHTFAGHKSRIASGHVSAGILFKVFAGHGTSRVWVLRGLAAADHKRPGCVRSCTLLPARYRHKAAETQSGQDSAGQDVRNSCWLVSATSQEMSVAHKSVPAECPNSLNIKKQPCKNAILRHDRSRNQHCRSCMHVPAVTASDKHS